MTEKELDEWESVNNFVSYRSILKSANKEWSAITEESQIQAFAKKYNDILTIEASSVSPRIKIRSYQSIVNRAGIYQTSEYLNKVVGGNIYTIQKNESEKLNLMLPSDPAPCQLARKAQRSGIVVNPYVAILIDPCNSGGGGGGPVNPPPPPPPPPSCQATNRAEYFLNESGCSDDRLVAIFGISYLLTYTTFEGTWRQPRVKIEVDGKIRLAFWCIWASYKTQLEYRNVSFSIMAYTRQNDVGFPTLFTRSLPDYFQAHEDINLVWDRPIGDAVLNQVITPSAFTSLHAEGKSRGTGVNGWAVIDCR